MTSPVKVPRPTPRGVPSPLRPAARVRPDLRVVREPLRRTRTRFFVGLSAVSVFAALFVAGMAHSMLVGGQARLDQVNRQIQTETQLLEREQLVLAERQAPGRIAAEAAALGMVDGGQQTWMSLDPQADAAVAQRSAAAAADADAEELAGAPSDGATGEG